MHRQTKFSEAEKRVFDLAVIGGGITGAGIFYEASQRGYSCILIEKNDFASGTSSRSAKLVHGGLRYLKYGQLSLVREGLRERNYLLKNFPHLVKPLEFLLPVYGSKIPYSIGMWLYKQLSLDKDISTYRFLDRNSTINYLPSINQKKLQGGFLFYDAVTNDARLTNEIIQIASEKNNSSALNYCEFLSCSDMGLTFTLKCRDSMDLRNLEICSKYIINSAGPWSDIILKRLEIADSNNSAPSKGAHLVFSREKIPISSALLFSSYADDDRMLYAVPWENNSVIVGATDTDFKGNPDEVAADASDVNYLLHALRHFLPLLSLSEKDILSIFAGLRPLLNSGKQSKDRKRDYRCWWSHERILNILGGKFTGFHAMANTALEKLNERISPSAGNQSDHQINSGTAKKIFSEELVKHITFKYGPKAEKVFRIAEENDEHAIALSDEVSIIPAEIIFFIRFQSSWTLEDLLQRRFSLIYVLKKIKCRKEIIQKIASVMQAELNWTEETKLREIDHIEMSCNQELII